jgi:hypothetical protein
VVTRFDMLGSYSAHRTCLHGLLSAPLVCTRNYKKSYNFYKWINLFHPNSLHSLINLHLRALNVYLFAVEI